MMKAAAATLRTATSAVKDQLGEFRGQTLVVATAMLGLILCSPTMMTYSFGVFINAFRAEQAWSLADMSLTWVFYTGVIFLGSALVGRLADRFDPGRVAACSMLAFGAMLILAPYLVHDVTGLWAAYIAFSILGLGTTPVVLLKPVVAAFSKSRGLAVGLAIAGQGIGAFLMPQITTALIAEGGWRLGYIGLGCLAVAAAPLLWLALSRAGNRTKKVSGLNVSAASGVTFKEAARSRNFWMLTAVSILSGFGVAGVIVHLVPMLAERNISATAAAAFASALGLASLAGRIAAGATLDRLRGPIAGFLFFSAGAAGVALLMGFGVQFALIAVILVGLALGSEVDVIAYFVSRYFGLRAHASIFGWNYGAVALGGGVSPYMIGLMRDHMNGYGAGLALLIAALIASAFLCLMLGPYKFAVTREEPAK